MATLERLDGITRDRKQAYRVRWREREPDGATWKSRQQRVYGYDEAEKLRGEMAALHEGPSGNPPSRITLSEAGEQWLRYYATKPRRRRGGGGSKRVEPTSWDEAARTVEYVLDQLGGDTTVATITEADLETLVEGRRHLVTGAPVADGTRERLVGVLKAWFGDAVRFGWHNEDIAANLPSSWGPSGNGRRTVIPSVRALDAIAEDLDRPTQPVRTRGGALASRPRWLNVYDADRWRPSDRLWFIALTGCSWSEAAGLRLADDLGDHLALTQVWLRGTDAPRDYGKAAARVPRDIPVVSRLRPVLDRLAEYTRCEHLLTGPDGLPLSYETWRNRLSASATQAGHPGVSTHVLRHTAASLWIKAGAAPFLVMKAGGWSNLDMVSKVYGHLWPSDVVELGRKVDALDWDALD